MIFCILLFVKESVKGCRKSIFLFYIIYKNTFGEMTKCQFVRSHITFVNKTFLVKEIYRVVSVISNEPCCF